MATRRIAKSSVNWSALAERVPPNQASNFASFKAKSDNYMRAVLANPESPPKIDWEHYKRMIPIKGLVDTFKQNYETLKVPYPTENLTAQVDKEIAETKKEIEQFKCTSDELISEYCKEIEHLKSLLPYDQMTMEDFRDAFPERALDPINRPTFWPHTPEDQLGYKPKDQQQGGH